MPTIQSTTQFGSQASTERRRSISGRSLSINNAGDAWAGLAFVPLYVGAAAEHREGGSIAVGLSIHDGTYSIDFAIHHIIPEPGETIAAALKNAAKRNINKFCEVHCGKLLAAGLTKGVTRLCPDISSFLWSELDILAVEVDVKTDQTMTTNYADTDDKESVTETIHIGVDEQADSAVRKALMFFGPHNLPTLSIGFRNRVEVNTGGFIHLQDSAEEYKKTVSEETWKCVEYFSKRLKERKVKIAFFSATPQGGGVALMRHALIRFFKLLNIQADWYIPKPNPTVFRITKNNHNILQGVAPPTMRFTEENQKKFQDWITHNAQRYWLSPGGPLAKGGADIIIIDDPQMPELISLIKESRPEAKIIYRSHIEIRSDLVHQEGSPQAEVFNYIWNLVKQADLFISHPVQGFVPSDVPKDIVGLMPAATDWLDGLNKPMREWDMRYYHHLFRNDCHNVGMAHLSYPSRDYIAQIARFDPSKGIPTVLEAYRRLRNFFTLHLPDRPPPQLLICGHGAIDDPDGSIIYDQVIEILDTPAFNSLRQDIVIMRVGPSDQILNALLSAAKIIWQLSSREGFEIKVSEALHKGKPVIATRAGGIPLQIRHGETGYLVDVDDASDVAIKTFELLNNEKKYREMSQKAKASVSDEVSTVGNAVCWMYLADQLEKGEGVKPKGRWVADLAREEVGVGWKESENRLPRGIKVVCDPN